VNADPIISKGEGGGDFSPRCFRNRAQPKGGGGEEEKNRHLQGAESCTKDGLSPKPGGQSSLSSIKRSGNETTNSTDVAIIAEDHEEISKYHCQ